MGPVPPTRRGASARAARRADPGAPTSPNGRGKMSSTETPIDMLEPIEDRGGAAQPLLQVTGLTKHFPVRGELFAKRKTVRAVDDVSFSIAKGETVGIVG